jgi:hypothetical protein
MRGFVLQDWVTIRGATAITTVVQNEAGWLSLEMYQDVIFWLQVAEVTATTTNITLAIETAPIKDETLFKAMTNCTNTPTSASVAPTLNNVILSNSTVQSGTPLSRWVRWHLTQNNTAAWDITFRILVSANQLFSPGMGGGYGGFGGGAGWGTQMR